MAPAKTNESNEEQRKNTKTPPRGGANDSRVGKPRRRSQPRNSPDRFITERPRINQFHMSLRVTPPASPNSPYTPKSSPTSSASSSHGLLIDPVIDVDGQYEARVASVMGYIPHGRVLDISPRASHSPPTTPDAPMAQQVSPPERRRVSLRPVK